MPFPCNSRIVQIGLTAHVIDDIKWENDIISTGGSQITPQNNALNFTAVIALAPSCESRQTAAFPRSLIHLFECFQTANAPGIDAAKNQIILLHHSGFLQIHIPPVVLQVVNILYVPLCGAPSNFILHCRRNIKRRNLTIAPAERNGIHAVAASDIQHGHILSHITAIFQILQCLLHALGTAAHTGIEAAHCLFLLPVYSILWTNLCTEIVRGVHGGFPQLGIEFQQIRIPLLHKYISSAFHQLLTAEISSFPVKDSITSFLFEAL